MIGNSKRCQMSEMYGQVKTLNKARNTIERSTKIKNYEDKEKESEFRCFACCGSRIKDKNMDGILDCKGICGGYYHANCLVDHGFSESELKNIGKIKILCVHNAKIVKKVKEHVIGKNMKDKKVRNK